MEEDTKKCSPSSSGETTPPSSSPQMSPHSPTTQSVEDLSLQQAMDKNKESLKRKLMMRRSVNELREQGIYPPLKTPPAFAEQSKHLERAKTGDILRQKLQHRPDRQALVQHHILEDSTADPSLQERQRLLKKARLQDCLSNSLAHRPGPLELVEGNILCDTTLQDAIKEGKLLFPKTKDADESHEALRFSFTSEEESDGALSPSVSDSSSSFAVATPSPAAAIPSPPDITPLLQKLHHHSSVTSASFSFATQVAPVFTGSASVGKNSFHTLSNGGKNLSRIKKNKPKSTPKSKIIKFHEYKGPPNKQQQQQQQQQQHQQQQQQQASPCSSTSSSCSSSSGQQDPSGSTPYNILLQQQQLFLQWQLDSQKKSMPFILPPQHQQQLFQAQNSSPVRPHTPASSPQPTLTLAQVPGGTLQPVRAITPLSAGQSPTMNLVASNANSFPSNIIPTSLIQSKAAASAAAPVVSVSAPNVENICVVVSSASSNAVKSPMVATATMTAQKKQPPTTHITAAIPAGFKIVKLEELKVADLKAELKKRNLTVSGPKPVLIERLKPHLGGDTLLVTTCPVAPVARLPSSSSIGSAVSDSPGTPQMTPPPAPPLPAARQKQLEGMALSPPMSPAMSPSEAMDVASPGCLPQDAQSRPPSVVPMDVDALLEAAEKQKSPGVSALRATPPCVQQTKKTAVFKPFAAPVSRPSAQTVTCKPQQQTAIVKPQVHSQMPQTTLLSQASSTQPVKVQIQAPVKPHIQVSSRSDSSVLMPHIQVRLPSTPSSQDPAPVGQPQVISPSELLNHQQVQIMELARQLHMSQKELKDKEDALTLKSQELADAQKKAVAHQEQLKKHLTHAQAQALATIASMPNACTHVEMKPILTPSLLSQQQPQQQQQFHPLQSVRIVNSTGPKTIATVTNTPAGMGPLRLIKTEDGKTCVIPEPPPLPQKGQVSISAPDHKIVHFTTSTNGLVIKQEEFSPAPPPPPPPSSSVTSCPSPLNANICITSTSSSLTKVSPANLNKSSSCSPLPPSPVTMTAQSPGDQTSLLATPGKLHRSATSPASTSFMSPVPAIRDPPNYHEAIKNKQNLIMSQISIDDMNGDDATITTASTSLATNSSTMATGMKSQIMDDVLDILIRSGELPADIGQDPRCSSASSTTTTTSSSTSSSSSSSSSVVKTEPVSMTPHHLQVTATIDSFPNDLSFDTLTSNTGANGEVMLDMLSPIGSPMTHGDLMDPGALSDLMNMEWSDSDLQNGLLPPSSMHSTAPPSSVPQMDVADWLDVIMPQAASSSTADPILTPKPQDVLDLFNMEESDLYAPAEVMTFENAMETTSSNT